MKNGKVTQETSKEKEMASLSKPYLVFYNTVQTAGFVKYFSSFQYKINYPLFKRHFADLFAIICLRGGFYLMSTSL